MSKCPILATLKLISEFKCYQPDPSIISLPSTFLLIALADIDNHCLELFHEVLIIGAVLMFSFP